MSTLGLYIVIVFFAAQFVAYFGWSNLGQIFAVKGAEFLESAGMTGPIIFIGFIAISATVNLMLGSASAQWADRKSTRLNSSHVAISYAVFCLKKKKRDTHGYIL